MWKKMYWYNDGELYRYIDYDGDEELIEQVGRYEIVFDFDNQRYYCFVDAFSINEALGIFFRNHDTVEYKNIVDHIEI
jgi:hypothetical protein